MAQIETLAQNGLDALSNHYAITFTEIGLISNFANYSDPLTMRILSIDIPDRSITTYDVNRRGRTFSRPSGMVEQEKEVTFNFRPDKNLYTYKVLSDWMQFVQNNVTGSLASDVDGAGYNNSTYRINAEVHIINSLDNNNFTGEPWKLLGCFPTSLGGISFSEDNGEPLECSCTLTCFNIEYPKI